MPIASRKYIQFVQFHEFGMCHLVCSLGGWVPVGAIENTCICAHETAANKQILYMSSRPRTGDCFIKFVVSF